MLVRIYHERWEIESASLALRHTILRGHVLRSGDPVGVQQEVWALLTVYQLLRTAMTDATASTPDTDPNRACFTTALKTARDQIITAQAVIPDDPTVLLGAIGRAVLATLLPKRRARFSARKVKSGTSRYTCWRDDGRPAKSTTVDSITTAVIEPAAVIKPAAASSAAREVRRRSCPTVHMEYPERAAATTTW